MQFLTSGSAVLIERIFEELIVFALPHPTGHINHCRRLIPNQVTFDLGLTIVNGIGHHLPQSISPAHTVRVSEHAPSLYNDPILSAQIAGLAVQLEGQEPACTNFQAMPPSVKKTYTKAYLDAKTDAGREKRLAWIIDRLNQNLKPM